jgi:hypothetical protein
VWHKVRGRRGIGAGAAHLIGDEVIVSSDHSGELR